MSTPVDHTDVGAYALGLLEDADRDAFEAHLLDCARCQAELDELGDMRGLFADVEADAFTPSPVDARPTAPMQVVTPPSRAAGFPASPDGGQEAPPDGRVIGGGETDREPIDGGAVERGATGGGATGGGVIGGQVVDFGARRTAKDRARRAGTALAAAAAAALLLVAGVAIGGGFEDSGNSPVAAESPHHNTTTSPAGTLLLTGERHPASGDVARGADGASGYVALETKGWGSHVGLELRGVHGPLVCSLFVVGKDGRTEEVGSWAVPAKGYGVATNPDPLIFHGGTSIPKDSLDRFEVRTKDGRTLLTVPM